MARGTADWRERNARIVRRRRIVRWNLWGLVGLIVMAAVVDHAGWFGALGGYRGDDWRLEGKTFAIKGVVSGDVVELDSGTQMRLMGVGWDRGGEEYLAGMLGRNVMIKFDPARTRDKQGRMVAYLYLGEGCLNVEMVRSGAGYADGSMSPVLLGTLKVAEGEARRKGVGRWKEWK